MCLFGVFCSSLPGKKEILQSKSLKSSFTEVHMCNIAYKWADLKRLQKINFKKPFLKPYARRSPHLVSISSSRSINAGTTRQLTWQWRRSLLQSEVMSAGKVTVHLAFWHITCNSDECKYFFVNHLFHCFIQVSNQIVACWVTGKKW